MLRSLNQIEQTARKAVRGCAREWGLAIASGRAVRRLHAHGLDGAGALVKFLDAQTLSPPQSLDGVWRADNGALDALICGAALSDCIVRAQNIETESLAHPLLAAGFILEAAYQDDFAARMKWRGVEIACARGGVRVRGDGDALYAARVWNFSCARVDAAGENLSAPSHAHAKVTREVWEKLDAHARKTYVEASEASRLSGAGAGLRDND